MNRIVWRMLVGSGFWLWATLPLFAQDSTGTGGQGSTEDARQEERSEPVPPEFASPRDTIRTLLQAVPEEDYELAADCLDLQFLDMETRGTKRKSLCDKMYVLLKNGWEVDPAAAPSVDIDQPFPLDSALGLVDSPDAAIDAAKVKLAKSENGRWQFTSDSVRLVDEELYDKWVGQTDVARTTDVKMNFPMWLESQIPAGWKRRSFLIKDYQWLALLILLFAGLAVDLLARLLLNWITNIIFRNTLGNEDYQADPKLWKPVGLLLNALTWYFGASLIDLPAGFLMILLVALKVFAVFAFIWTAFSTINLLGDYLLRKAKRNNNRYEHLLIPFVKNGLKILAVCLGLVVFVDVFALNWNSLLGGFGIGGIAIAIASKDVLGNVFGSITVLTDRPFEIGDWVITEGVEGEVESVGMRSSRIRTFYNSLVVIPNNRLTTAIVDNMGRRQYRRVKAMVGVEYGTSPEQLEAFCEGIRELIRQSKVTRKDSFYVYVNEFGASSINILLYFFLKTPDWSSELHERHMILINIVKLAKELKVRFAYPTQTLHVTQHEPLNGELTAIDSPREAGRAAAAEVVSRR